MITRSEIVSDISPAELKSMIRIQCERSAARMENIDEEIEDNESENEDIGINPCVSGSLPYTKNNE